MKSNEMTMCNVNIEEPSVTNLPTEEKKISNRKRKTRKRKVEEGKRVNQKM